MRNIKIPWQIICICGLILLGSTLFTSCSAVTSFYTEGVTSGDTPSGLEFLDKFESFYIAFAWGTDGEPICYLWAFAIVTLVCYTYGSVNHYKKEQYWHKDFFTDKYEIRERDTDEVISYGSEEVGRGLAALSVSLLICVFEFILIWNNTDIRNALAIAVIVIVLCVEAWYLALWCGTYFFYFAKITWYLVLADFVIGCAMYLYQISF